MKSDAQILTKITGITPASKHTPACIHAEYNGTSLYSRWTSLLSFSSTVLCSSFPHMVYLIWKGLCISLSSLMINPLNLTSKLKTQINNICGQYSIWPVKVNFNFPYNQAHYHEIMWQENQLNQHESATYKWVSNHKKEVMTSRWNGTDTPFPSS